MGIQTRSARAQALDLPTRSLDHSCPGEGHSAESFDPGPRRRCSISRTAALLRIELLSAYCMLDAVPGPETGDASSLSW